jgi:hypothetical protein
MSKEDPQLAICQKKFIRDLKKCAFPRRKLEFVGLQNPYSQGKA